MADFDELVSLEDKLIEQLDTEALVDGHDFGQSKFNIFILTDEPVKAFDKAQQVALGESKLGNMRAAYRPVNDDDYVILWPPGLIEFSLE